MSVSMFQKIVPRSRELGPMELGRRVWELGPRAWEFDPRSREQGPRTWIWILDPGVEAYGLGVGSRGPGVGHMDFKLGTRA